MFNLPLIGQGQRNRKEHKENDKFIDEKAKLLRQWEIDNNILIRPILVKTDSSLRADISLQVMSEELKAELKKQLESNESLQKL